MATNLPERCYGPSNVLSANETDVWPRRITACKPPPPLVNSKRVVLFGDWQIRRDRLIYLSHLICAVLHCVGFAMSIDRATNGNDYTVQTYRVRVEWDEKTRGGFLPTLVESGTLDLAWLCTGFFGLSFAQHMMWVLLGGYDCSIEYLWRNIDHCICWWCVPRASLPFGTGYSPRAHMPPSPRAGDG